MGVQRKEKEKRNSACYTIFFVFVTDVSATNEEEIIQIRGWVLYL